MSSRKHLNGKHPTMSAGTKKRYSIENGNPELVEHTGWEAALEIAVEWNKNVQRLCEAVLSDDHETAKVLAKELHGDEVNLRSPR